MTDRGWYGNIIGWFAHNAVAANLLMLTLVVGGLYSAWTITKEVQPRIETNYVTVSVPYRGASPKDVEEGVLIKIEEAVQDLEGVREIISTANEGSGTVTIEVEAEYDIVEVLDNIKIRVDSIATFPAETERPTYRRNTWSQSVLWVSVFGEVPERTLKEVSRQIRDEITALPTVTLAEIEGDRPYEIGIEVTEETLRAYGMTLDEVARAVRQSSLDLPAGRIQAAGGDILVRSIGQAYVGSDFETIVVRTNPDGSRILLRDIAGIRDGFTENERYAKHNGRNAMAIQVFSVGNQDALAAARDTREFIEQRKQTLPDGISVEWWGDSSYYLADRLSLMGKNLVFGALLVFLILTLFLRLKLAFWVMVGLLVAFAGTVFLLPAFGVTINLVSLFGFLVVLGIVVDDAIVMGESAYTEIRNHGHSADNVVNGVMKVAVPATFGVLTTIAAFLPILMVSGISGQFFDPIGWVVVLALLMSLVESKLILPAHLAHMKIRTYQENETPGALIRFQRSFSNRLFRFVDAIYIPSLRAMLHRRYLSVSAFIGLLILSIGLIASPFVRVVLFPDVTGDFMQVNLTMNEGTPAELTHRTMDQLAGALVDAEARMMADLELDEPIVRTVFAWAGETTGNFVVEMEKTDDLRISTTELERLWRNEVGQLVGVRSLQIGGPGGPGGDGPDISFQLVGQDLQQLESAAKQLEQAVANFEGTFDIRNSFDGGIRELQLSIREEAEVLGLSQQDLARQVRSAFFGEEVQRIQRGQDDVRVMVRYPKEQRTSQGYLENMRIRTANGDEVPFSAVADIEVGSSPSRIRRYNRQRSVSVTARVDKEIAEPGPIVGQLRGQVLPEILSSHQAVGFRISGASRNNQELMQELAVNALFAIFLIYALIAIPLRSYIQPILIMSVIPFGMIGAVVGHLLLGIPISLLSMFGIIALAGVVINDSLILVDFVNKHRHQGESREDAIVKATRARFRPIILTSATTFLGLAPITLFEKSLQAQLVVPMAVSLSFGILFATAITLALIPLLYLIADDFKQFSSRYFEEMGAFFKGSSSRKNRRQTSN